MATINFDMDGTIARFYDVPHWLDYLKEEDTTPYAIAKPALRFSAFAKRLNTLQRNGFRLSIISWTSKCGTKNFNSRIAETKREWLAEHLPSVHWDEIHIVPYGTPKQMFAHGEQDILFDDEEPNRTAWTGKAYDVTDIMEILKSF